VRRIPTGRVASYGQVARLAGIPRGARQVGYALHALPDASDVPWHRVVGAEGRVKVRAIDGPAQLQARLLAREGVRFDRAGRIDLARFGWTPRGIGQSSVRCSSTNRR
jgi:methylated-DNA-protein-cysteine methyltransferase-like protein